MQEAPRSIVPLKIVSSGATDIGRVRPHNEDAVCLRPDLSLYVVADGAGGENAGNIASALATSSISHFFEATAAEQGSKPAVDALGLPWMARRLSRAVLKANRDIVEIAKTSNKYKGMGTTVVAVAVQPELGKIHVAHVGDSRCYRLREGRFEPLTVDHSLTVDILEQHPDLDDAILSKLPRNVVTRALGMTEALRVSVRTHALLAGDRYVICSDGLTAMLDDDEIADVLRVSKNADEATRTLIDMANEAGATDNVAVVVLQCDLSPGVSGFPRRASSIPPKQRIRTPPPTPAIEPSYPEIVILGTETLDVVPAESSSPNLLSLLEPLRQTVRVRPQRPSATPPAIPKPANETEAKVSVSAPTVVAPVVSIPASAKSPAAPAPASKPATPPPPPTPSPASTKSSAAPAPEKSAHDAPRRISTAEKETTTIEVDDPPPASRPISRASSARRMAVKVDAAGNPTCEKCGKSIENAGLVCPHCGTPRELR